LVSGRPGIYFRVLQEGKVEAGDSIKFLYKDKNNITVKDIVRIYLQSGDIEEMHRIMKVKALPSGWRDHFR
jgi:MOSC domain-containing protein YiiM